MVAQLHTYLASTPKALSFTPRRRPIFPLIFASTSLASGGAIAAILACALRGMPQSIDVVPPASHEAVLFGIATFVPHAAFAERKLMLRVHKRR